MAEPLSDYSKILELQEIKRMYDEVQERHQGELASRDEEIQRLRQELAQLAEQEHQPGAVGELADLREERDRLAKQVQLVRQELGAKVERLNARIRELTASGNGGGGGGAQPAAEADPAKRGGFFRR